MNVDRGLDLELVEKHQRLQDELDQLRAMPARALSTARLVDLSLEIRNLSVQRRKQLRRAVESLTSRPRADAKPMTTNPDTAEDAAKLESFRALQAELAALGRLQPSPDRDARLRKLSRELSKSWR